MSKIILGRLKKIVTHLILSDPFYGLVSRYFCFQYNKDFEFLAGVRVAYPHILFIFSDKIEALTNEELTTLVRHEALHFALGHTSMPNWSMLDNIAADLAINSHLSKDDIISMNGIIPGGKGFEDFPLNKSLEHYLRLLKVSKEADLQDYNFDDHSEFKPDENDGQIIKNGDFVKELMSDIVKELDNTNSWGNLHKDLKESIKRYIFGQYNWSKHLRNLICRVRSNKILFSRKRKNKRFPNMFPGVIRQYRTKIMVGIDESGSVNNEIWKLFMQKLSTLHKYADFVFVPFDCTVNKAGIAYFKESKKLLVNRSSSGGTCFSSITAYFNGSDCDALFVFTDGQAGEPIKSKRKRIWILPNDCNLAFETSESKVFIS